MAKIKQLAVEKRLAGAWLSKPLFEKFNLYLVYKEHSKTSFIEAYIAKVLAKEEKQGLDRNAMLQAIAERELDNYYSIKKFRGLGNWELFIFRVSDKLSRRNLSLEDITEIVERMRCCFDKKNQQKQQQIQ